MSQFLEGIDRSLVHRAYLLREQAKANGCKTSIVAIFNALLADALTDDRWDDLVQRFCVKAPPDTQAKLFGGETCPS